MIFKVNCKAGAGKLVGAARFALCISLEVAEGVRLPIYEEIASRIQVKSEVQVSA